MLKTAMIAVCAVCRVRNDVSRCLLSGKGLQRELNRDVCIYICCCQVGDGTTSVVLLAGEILKHVKGFVEDGLHPQVNASTAVALTAGVAAAAAFSGFAAAFEVVVIVVVYDCPSVVMLTTVLHSA